ncbi:flagellar basal body P-ring formation protein FlgA [Ruegeria pomeroyi]|uniref:Flagella basal body P-ring formation protein FlgA n=2 Tax=Ruegeria pomeroyi TaxID=89184 RepID=Q5LWX6_RUEPO|nr:flagellar basal body P-ring formation chaperone FlgA [Ruegeria pomeroyi]HCE70471.1 flagella basal body P-ring formation protein FlgA [Ruegeria sp.]AAV93502.1 flagellar basal-body P-ring formation protein FlgA [Ruegeria pomeroyi DSS-3]NVK96566.1 flagellar basal body P-ring formation protein FlgA [Ruegeria pomeroyi]NVL01591.1 flagellar basal body P-ring formation protein FlgA [Ruegeria pomeroyi]QWV10795.1 flagellar basal body P-ring formation protein FlgA [Ruegeria pomeroyi]
MRYLGPILALVLAQTAAAEVLVPTRTIRAKEIIGAEDLMLKSAEVPGSFTDPAEVIGQEARVALYAGRPIRYADIGPPAIVDRNDLVTLFFDNGPLVITTEGRALGRGAAGDVIRVMNLTSRTTVSGQIRPNGSIEVK